MTRGLRSPPAKLTAGHDPCKLTITATYGDFIHFQNCRQTLPTVDTLHASITRGMRHAGTHARKE